MNMFLENIAILKRCFGEIKLLLIVIILAIFYFYNSYYFKCSLITDGLSISYYQSNNDYSDWILIFILSLLYIIICNSIVKSQQNQFIKDINKNNFAKSNTDIKPLSSSQTTFSKKSLKFIISFILFVWSESFVVISVIFESLPENNIFGFGMITIQIIQNSIALILTINMCVIIPSLVDYTYDLFCDCNRNNNKSIYLCKYRPLIILFLRTLSALIIPLISSIFLLQNCGNNWVFYWKECDETQKGQFDIIYYSDDYGEYGTLLTSSSVCDSVSILNIDWNKCIRSFTSNWSIIITQKLCIMIVMPFLLIIYKKIENKIISLSTYLSSIYDTKRIHIDLEYSMILTKCESMIIWGAISPFIIPLTLMSITTNHYYYNKMINKKNWKINPFTYDGNNVIFPIYILWIDIIISQIFISLFLFISLNNGLCGSILCIVLLIVDIMFILKSKFFDPNKQTINILSINDIIS